MFLIDMPHEIISFWCIFRQFLGTSVIQPVRKPGSALSMSAPCKESLTGEIKNMAWLSAPFSPVTRSFKRFLTVFLLVSIQIGFPLYVRGSFAGSYSVTPLDLSQPLSAADLTAAGQVGRTAPAHPRRDHERKRCGDECFFRSSHSGVEPASIFECGGIIPEPRKPVSQQSMGRGGNAPYWLRGPPKRAVQHGGQRLPVNSSGNRDQYLSGSPKDGRQSPCASG